jgi:serine protease inhibitor
MKRFFLILATGLLLFSCKKEKTEVFPIVDFVNNKKAAELIEADTRFGLDLFRQVLSMDEAPENLMISPVSVAVALGMTYNGAEGNTKTAFEETLRFKGYTREEINTIHQALINHILSADPKVIMEIANSIWYRQGFDVLQSFIDVNKDFYNAEVQGLNFIDPSAKDIINDWCALKTHDKIKNVLDEIPPDAVMYLINAIYFNGTWTYQFDESKSYTGTFYKENGAPVDAGYMKMQTDIAYLTNDLFSAVDLPYGNKNFSMSILLPKNNKNVNDIIEQLNAENFAKWTSEFAKKEVIVTIPKFKFGYKELLNNPLKNMGLGNAFSGNADFTGINPGGDLCISRVIHQSFIDVNEKGTEAAAVTVVEITYTSAGPPDDKTFFTADHPFVFVIREKTSNAILFIGKVGNPVYEP